MRKDVITRNIERLTDSEPAQEPLEPMSAWKWNKLYRLARQYGIGPWIADGIRRHEDDFYMNIPAGTRQQLLELKGEKDKELLERYHLETGRRLSAKYRYSKYSLQVYLSDFIHTIKNIEE